MKCRNKLLPEFIIGAVIIHVLLTFAIFIGVTAAADAGGSPGGAALSSNMDKWVEVPCPTSEYQQKLTQIGFKDTASVAEAADELLKIAKAQSDRCKEELLFLFREYYFASLAKCNEKIDQLKIDETSKDNLNKSLAKVGWTIKMSEGNYYLGESPTWFATEFKEILTATYREYFRLRSQEIREGFSEDAGLLISWEQLRKRIITWENFLHQYPDFVEKANIQPYLADYLSTYLGGMDNTRIYGKKMALKKEVKVSYENFIKKNKSSKYHSIVKEFYEMIKKNGYIVPKNYETFLDKKNFKTLLGVQPPTY